MESIAQAEFWENRYQAGTDRWDLGQAAPPFVSLLQSSERPPTGRIAVLGCGRGYDALLFAAYGFEVIGFDFAPSAIAAAQALAQATGSAAKFRQQDIFDLSSEFPQNFDYVLEHTCFCAINPELRAAYVKLVSTILRPAGELIGLFWAHTRLSGPPFGVTIAELRRYFTPEFEVLSLVPVTNSVPERQGEEYLGRFQVKKVVSSRNLAG